MKHLYVHIPFCRSLCAYCDFASELVGPHARAGRLEPYVAALRTELDEQLSGGSLRGDGRGDTPADVAPRLETIYLGGGTPTLMPPELLLPLVADLAKRLVAPGAEPATGRRATAGETSGSESGESLGGALPEFTIEANPGTIDVPLLETLAEAGVNRLSLGVQSFSPALRAVLGRRVAQREIDAALEAIGLVGWREWNLDLVFGMPGQTWDHAAADIDAAVAAGPTHISLYDLTYTAGYLARLNATKDDRAARGGNFDIEAADSFAEAFFAEAVARLQAAGYRRYEVSNFALPGHECRHNLAYWRGADYLGIGAAAVSTVGSERRTNPRSVAGYLRGDSPDVEVVSAETRLWEKAMLGLRTIEGVDESEVAPTLDREALARLLEQGCVERGHGKLRLNSGFLDVSNAVISALLVHPGVPTRLLDSGALGGC